MFRANNNGVVKVNSIEENPRKPDEKNHITTRLLLRARAGGVVRADVTHADLKNLLVPTGSTCRSPAPSPHSGRLITPRIPPWIRILPHPCPPSPAPLCRALPRPYAGSASRPYAESAVCPCLCVCTIPAPALHVYVAPYTAAAAASEDDGAGGISVRACVGVADSGVPGDQDADIGWDMPVVPNDPALSMRATGVGYWCWFLWRGGHHNGGEPPNDPADPALSMRATGVGYRPWRCKWRCKAGACGVGVDTDNDRDDVEGRRGSKWRTLHLPPYLHLPAHVLFAPPLSVPCVSLICFPVVGVATSRAMDVRAA
ncbi:hypothetical protein C8J57DRAFT_1719356 [Mycena rebaudengoi]|nr:hypothetical protein C8J57DRAFT_1719356 [Mycena rebaudengoi]